MARSRDYHYYVEVVLPFLYITFWNLDRISNGSTIWIPDTKKSGIQMFGIQMVTVPDEFLDGREGILKPVKQLVLVCVCYLSIWYLIRLLEDVDDWDLCINNSYRTCVLSAVFWVMCVVIWWFLQNPCSSVLKGCYLTPTLWWRNTVNI